jgi:hypothetical protein
MPEMGRARDCRERDYPFRQGGEPRAARIFLIAVATGLVSARDRAIERAKSAGVTDQKSGRFD